MENGQTKAEMFDQFQTWALRNYGDSGKTKTVTKRKHDRIMRFLNGEEAPTTENAKFRFWVKAKGFKLGPGEGDESMKDVLYVPVKTTSHSEDSIIIEKGYKRVAVVEDFFDIIYNVHVEMDARGGKHAGQKRTYKAIAENYAFLPREAVTRFLMSCNECQKRMHLSPIATNENNHILEEVPVIDYSLPITTTYHIQQQKRKLSATYELQLKSSVNLILVHRVKDHMASVRLIVNPFSGDHIRCHLRKSTFPEVHSSTIRGVHYDSNPPMDGRSIDRMELERPICNLL